MATWASLTPAQQKVITDYVGGTIRPLASQLAIVLNHMNAANIAWNAQVSAVNALLTGTEVILDNTSLVGAAQITATELTNIVTAVGGIQAILSSAGDAAHYQEYSKLCGAGNIIG